VTDQRYDQSKVTEYRAAATELHELSLTVERRMNSAIENGNKQDALDALAELRASSAEFQGLRSTLTPTDLFIAKYNIQVHGAHEVSFVLPTGVSRYEMLLEAQRVVGEREGRELVWRGDLKKWEKKSKFTDTCTTPERIQIDGHVEGGDGMPKDKQLTLLETKGLSLATLEDLAAAFVAHYIATGEPLFGWYSKSDGWSFVVRAAGGALRFYSHGLYVYGIGDGDSSSYVAVSARVPRN
jgi:hypothetical protein